MEEYNLSYEKRIVDLLNYSIEQTDKNKWIIKDENNNEVGNIIAEKNEDSEIEYTSSIQSDIITFTAKRVYDHKDYTFRNKNGYLIGISFNKSFFGYGPEISIYDDDGQYKIGQYITVNLGDTKHETGLLSPCSCSHGISVDYKYQINGYYVKEGVSFRNMDYSENNIYKTYSYELIYNKTENDTNGYQLLVYNSIDEPNKLVVSERKFEDNDLGRIKRQAEENEKEKKRISELGFFERLIEQIKASTKNQKKNKCYFFQNEKWDGREEENKTALEFAYEHGRGFELFNIVRSIIKEIMPFKEDIFYTVMKDKIDEYQLGFLFEEEKEKENTK